MFRYRMVCRPKIHRRATILQHELPKCVPPFTRARFLTQDSGAAEDLVQETLERALLHRARYRRETNLSAWLATIMRNLFVDHYRKRVNHTRLCESLSEPVLDASVGPLDLLLPVDVIEAVALLEPAHRALFDSFYSDHLTYREIASRFGIGTNTAGTRLLRIRLKLRRTLEQIYQQRLGALGGPRSGSPDTGKPPKARRRPS